MCVMRVMDNVLAIDITPKELEMPFICSYAIVSGNEVAIVESGPTVSARILYEKLKDLKLHDKVKYVIPTHIHLDHGGGVGSLLKLLKNAKAYVHPRAVPHLINPDKLWELASEALGWLAEVYKKPEPTPSELLIGTTDGQRIRVGNLTLRIIHTPGHASHHQSVMLEESKTLFIGDSAGIYVFSENYVIPTTMPPIRLDMYVKSIDKQIAENPTRICYTHFGCVDNGREALIKHKEQVLAWFKGVKEALSEGKDNVDDILEYILRYDEEAEKLKKIASSKRAYRILVELALLGFRDEAKRIDKLTH